MQLQLLIEDWIFYSSSYCYFRCTHPILTLWVSREFPALQKYPVGQGVSSDGSSGLCVGFWVDPLEINLMKELDFYRFPYVFSECHSMLTKGLCLWFIFFHAYSQVLCRSFRQDPSFRVRDSKVGCCHHHYGITVTGFYGTLFWNSWLFPYLVFWVLWCKLKGTLINIQSTWLKASVYQGFPFKSLSHYKKTMSGSALPAQHFKVMLMILESKDISHQLKVTKISINLNGMQGHFSSYASY